ncbi:hypothetical protein OH77DRAFT_503291 [Trametes cingulata]|nr:hypothetical protein OH77DRAFT_503291 [Trametes cingulata]
MEAWRHDNTTSPCTLRLGCSSNSNSPGQCATRDTLVSRRHQCRLQFACGTAHTLLCFCGAPDSSLAEFAMMRISSSTHTGRVHSAPSRLSTSDMGVSDGPEIVPLFVVQDSGSAPNFIGRVPDFQHGIFGDHDAPLQLATGTGRGTLTGYGHDSPHDHSSLPASGQSDTDLPELHFER